MARSSISLQDVAREAGVSPQTVSRVANGSTAVRAETRAKVEIAMEKLGYHPNYAARALKSGRFNNIGVLLSHMSAFGNARILEGIVDAAAEQGYSTTIHTLDNLQDRSLSGALRLVRDLPLDGVIVIMERDFTDFNQFKPPQTFPVVLISEEPANNCVTIDSDSYGCSTAAVDYLLSKGHRTVYHIAGPSSSRAAQSRIRGWRDALAQAGADIPSIYIGDWEANSGYQAGLALAHEEACTAVYAANDQMAYGAMLGLQAAGKRVPEDVSIIGVDDSLEGMVPRLELTTLRLRFHDVGREAFSMIKRQHNGEKVAPGIKTVIPPEFIDRGSVRALRQP